MNVLTLDLWEDWLLLRAYGGSGRMVADAPGALTKASAVLFASGAVIVPLASIDGVSADSLDLRLPPPLLTTAAVANTFTRWRVLAAFNCCALGGVCHV